MADRTLERLRADLEAATPDAWPRVLRSVGARQAVTELLTALDRPPSAHSRLGWELRERVRESIPLRRVA